MYVNNTGHSMRLFIKPSSRGAQALHTLNGFVSVVAPVTPNRALPAELQSSPAVTEPIKVILRSRVEF